MQRQNMLTATTSVIQKRQQRQTHPIKGLTALKCDVFKGRVSSARLPGAAEPEGRE